MARVGAKADTSWIPAFRKKYEEWFKEARALIEAHQYPAAFKTYPFPHFDRSPWSLVRTPLSRGRLGLVSTAALFRRNLDPSFAEAPEGDGRTLEIPSDVDLESLETAHTHIPHEPIRADRNVALPLEHLRELVRAGRIGELAPRVFSLNGYRTRADEVATETAPPIAAAMAADGVSHVLLIPV
jgi:hypothetical protein